MEWYEEVERRREEIERDLKRYGKREMGRDRDGKKHRRKERERYGTREVYCA